MRRALVVALALAGCKSPSYRNGGLQCSSAGDCPMGWHCAGDRTCWKNGSDPNLDFGPTPIFDLAGAVGGDLPLVQDMSSCGWSLRPSNFDPCTLDAVGGDWVATTGSYDTDAGAGASGPFGNAVTQPAGGLVRLVHVGMFSVPTGVTLTIVGSLPLMIVADNGAVDGTIVVRPGAATGGGTCSVVVNGNSNAACGAGGAGGAFGATGGAGGACSGVAAPAAPVAVGNAQLVPLRGGCGGGHGGAPAGTQYGIAGVGGGALQISARVGLFVTGTINAGGAPGGGSAGSITGSGAAGGSGGGSGGAILVESPMVSVTGKLCANGAGGGQGATNGSGTAGGSGMNAGCSDAAATGGSGVGSGGFGGDGGHASHPDGVGGTGVANNDGGGAGGGSVGRIRVHAANGSPVGGSAVVTPAPYLN